MSSYCLEYFKFNELCPAFVCLAIVPLPEIVAYKEDRHICPNLLIEVHLHHLGI